MRSGLAEVGDDFADGARLRQRQRVGQGLDQLLPQVPGSCRRAAGGAAQMRAHQRQRELSGQQLVIGEARPGHAFRPRVGRLGRMMQRA